MITKSSLVKRTVACTFGSKGAFACDGTVDDVFLARIDTLVYLKVADRPTGVLRRKNPYKTYPLTGVVMMEGGCVEDLNKCISVEERF